MGIEPSEEAKKKMREAAKYKPLKSDETKRKIAEGNRGKVVTKETRQKLSISRKGKPTTGRRVIDIQTNIVYNSCAEAARSIMMERHNLNKRLLGKIKNNTNFKYLENE